MEKIIKTQNIVNRAIKVMAAIVLAVFVTKLMSSNIRNFKNIDTANIIISENDSVIFNLEDVPSGNFKFYLKRDPRELEFYHDNAKVSLVEINTKYQVVVDYIDSTRKDVYFQ